MRRLRRKRGLSRKPVASCQGPPGAPPQTWETVVAWTSIGAVVLALASACGSSSSPSASAPDAAQTLARSHRGAARKLHIGQSATLRGASAGEELRVTLLAYDADLPGSTNDHPEFDYQFAAAQLQLSNVGTRSYSGAPEDATTVLSTESQTSKRTTLSEGSCAGSFARAVTLAPGESAEGCVPVQILVVSTPAELRFDAYPKGAPRPSAEWSLRPPHSSHG